MANTKSSSGGRGPVWMRTKFDLEGIGGGVAGVLIGILLGWLWSPLFWIGAVLAFVVLLATRSMHRVPPELANIVVAPCDGIVHSVARAVPPVELRIGGGEWIRVRISSSPFSTNPLYASITGEIVSLIEEEPDMSRLIAARADDDGLAVAHVAFQSLTKKMGYTAVTGGLGPRLDMNSEAGDPVRVGRVIGKRRLGGWCDVYLSSESKLLVSAGQTLIGAETVLCRLDVGAASDAEVAGEFEDEIASVETAAEEDLKDIGAATKEEPSPLEDIGDAAESAAETPAQDVTEMSLDPDQPDEPDDMVAALFKKLKQNEDKT